MQVVFSVLSAVTASNVSNETERPAGFTLSLEVSPLI